MWREEIALHESLKLLFTGSRRDHGLGILKLQKSVADGCNFELSHLETVESSALFFTHSPLSLGADRS
jgi:hypothetical protein